MLRCLFLIVLVPAFWYASAAPMLAWRALVVPVRYYKEELPRGLPGPAVKRHLELAGRLAPENRYVDLYAALWELQNSARERVEGRLVRFAQRAPAGERAVAELALLPAVRDRPATAEALAAVPPGLLSGSEALILCRAALESADPKLARKLLERAHDAGETGFFFEWTAGLLSAALGDWPRASARFERVVGLRGGAAEAPGYGFELLSSRFLLDEAGGADFGAERPAWGGRVVLTREMTRLVTANAYYNLIVCCRERAQYRRSMVLARSVLDRFAGAVRELELTRRLERSLYPRGYREQVAGEAARHSVDSMLVHAIIREESHYDASSLSRAGAIGLMQLMPDTALWAARRLRMKDVSRDRLAEPAVNIALGCWYLAYLQEKLGVGAQELDWVLAAYNGGPGNARRWHDRWKKLGGAAQDHISFPETRAYLEKVNRSYSEYRRLWQ